MSGRRKEAEECYKVLMWCKTVLTRLFCLKAGTSDSAAAEPPLIAELLVVAVVQLL